MPERSVNSAALLLIEEHLLFGVDNLQAGNLSCLLIDTPVAAAITDLAHRLTKSNLKLINDRNTFIL